MTLSDSVVSALESQYEDIDSVWFFVSVHYRILKFNKKSASNSVLFHGKELVAGDSILDYARDTMNDISEGFIACFGKAATGVQVNQEQLIVYKSTELWSRTSYSPVYDAGKLLGISIVVDDITSSKQNA